MGIDQLLQLYHLDNLNEFTDEQLQAAAYLFFGGKNQEAPNGLANWELADNTASGDALNLSPSLLRCLAEFLQVIIPKRLGIITKILSPPGADADDGMAAFRNVTPVEPGTFQANESTPT